MRYGLFSYHTENIGDEIQSIAARRFLPAVDEYVDRDNVGAWLPTEPTKIIMNGWYMHPPYAWPPVSDGIDPLLVSMYIDQADPNVERAFFSEESIHYLNAYGPVGARDLSSLEFLQQHGVNAYFSGCMTLTLQRDPDIPRGEFILAVDVPQPVVSMIEAHTDRPVIQSSPYYDADMSNEDRFAVAEYFLYLYQSAHAVVTTRLHAMLPSLALETPVLLVKDHLKYDSRRYAGLDSLVNSLTDEEYLEDYSKYDVNTPPLNPDAYLDLRVPLIERASSFTGYNNNRTFRTIDFSKLAHNESYVRTFVRGFSSLNHAALLWGDKAWLEEQNEDLRHVVGRLEANITSANKVIDDLRARNSQLEQTLTGVYTSRTWKLGRALTTPLRVFRRLTKGE